MFNYEIQYNHLVIILLVVFTYPIQLISTLHIYDLSVALDIRLYSNQSSMNHLFRLFKLSM